jgi:transcriptional regulator with XRE-family HTH domain
MAAPHAHRDLETDSTGTRDKRPARAVWSNLRVPIRISFGRACLDIRVGLDVSREQLAERVGVTPSYIGRIERGEANPSLRLVDAIADALGLDIRLEIRGPVLLAGPRVQDALHARCSAYVDRRLRGYGWATAREVEIVHGRSHGWIDLLAFDRGTGTLLIIEIKTRIDDLGALERQLGWYERMAWQPARRLGWRPTRLVCCVLALASDDVERVVRSVSCSSWHSRCARHRSGECCCDPTRRSRAAGLP